MLKPLGAGSLMGQALAVGQAGQAGEQAAAVAVDRQALVDFIHGQGAGHHDDVVGAVDGTAGTQASARVAGPGVDACRVAVLVQLAGARVKRNGHGLRHQAQPVLTRDLAGWRTQIVQMVVALLELVLKRRHAVSLVNRLWVVASGSKVKEVAKLLGKYQSRVTRTSSSRVVMPLCTSRSPSSRISVMPAACAAARISASDAWW